MGVFLLFFAAALAAIFHWYIKRPVVRAIVGFFAGFFGTMLLGVGIGLLIESGRDVSFGKSIALGGFKNSLFTAIATLVFLVIAPAVIKRHPKE